MPAPAIQGYLESGHFSSLSSWTVNAPSGIVSGELLLTSLQATVAPNAVPSGWTLVNSNTAASPRQYVYWKLATGSEPASYTWGFASGSSGWAQVHRINGVHQTTPVASSSVNVANPVALPSLTPPTVDCLELAFVILASGAAQTWTAADAGFTNHYTLSAGHLNLTAQPSLFRQALATTAATGIETFTPSAGTSHKGILVLVQPAPLNIAPGSIGSAQAFGTPGIAITPVGIASGEAIGGPVVTRQGDRVIQTAPGIGTAEAFGTPTVTSLKVLLPSGIGSAQALGATTVKYAQFITATGIPTAQALGLVGIGDTTGPDLIGFSDLIANQLLNQILGTGPAYTAPSTMYVALLTDVPMVTDTPSSMPEVGYTGYARVSLPKTSLGAAAARAKLNSVELTFVAPNVDITVSHVALITSAAGGEIIMVGAFDVPIAIGTGVVPKFSIGQLALAL